MDDHDIDLVIIVIIALHLYQRIKQKNKVSSRDM